MKRQAVRIINGLQAGASLALGGSVIYHAATNDGGWDGLSTLCRVSIIIWLITMPILIVMWRRCRSRCDSDPFPAGCKSGCDAIFFSLALLESLLLGFFCGVIQFPGPAIH